LFFFNPNESASRVNENNGTVCKEHYGTIYKDVCLMPKYSKLTILGVRLGERERKECREGIFIFKLLRSPKLILINRFLGSLTGSAKRNEKSEE
jgi:hypothetical protein